MKRENGHYFVKFRSENKWRVCLYQDGKWFWFGASVTWTDDDHPFTEISSEIIVHPDDKNLN